MFQADQANPSQTPAHPARPGPSSRATTMLCVSHVQTKATARKGWPSRAGLACTATGPISTQNQAFCLYSTGPLPGPSPARQGLFAHSLTQTERACSHPVRSRSTSSFGLTASSESSGPSSVKQVMRCFSGSCHRSAGQAGSSLSTRVLPAPTGHSLNARQPWMSRRVRPVWQALVGHPPGCQDVQPVCLALSSPWQE